MSRFLFDAGEIPEVSTFAKAASSPADPFGPIRSRADNAALPLRDRQRAGMELIKAQLIATERTRKATPAGLGVPLLARPAPGRVEPDSALEEARRHLAMPGR